jgi:hypothetical protein
VLLKLQKDIPIIFDGIATRNAGILMDPNSFLDLIYRDLSVCAWVCKYDKNDKDAVLTANAFLIIPTMTTGLHIKKPIS